MNGLYFPKTWWLASPGILAEELTAKGFRRKSASDLPWFHTDVEVLREPLSAAGQTKETGSTCDVGRTCVTLVPRASLFSPPIKALRIQRKRMRVCSLCISPLSSLFPKLSRGGERVTMAPPKRDPDLPSHLRRRFSLSFCPAVHSHPRSALASDAFLIPLRFTNIFFCLLFSVAVAFLLGRWREKNRTSTPLHILTSGEILSTVGLVASIVYLVGFFGIIIVQNFIGRTPDDDDVVSNFMPPKPLSPATTTSPPLPPKPQHPIPTDDADIVAAVVSGAIPSYSLESRLGDCKRAAVVRRCALEQMSGRSLDGLPIDGFDYESILGQCCEMPVGYVQIPVGIAGPLLLDGREFSVPMATTEGCLVASTNRGCKAIYMSGGATSVLTKDGMTRAPVVRFATAKRASELKFFLEDPINFDTLAVIFNRSSRFARLQWIQCSMAGKNLYMRFTCSTGDAMGMNMVSKGVQNVLDFLQADFPDMDVISISGNFCSDKKPAAVNWIEGRGKSVVCEAIINEEVVRSVLKTSVSALVELNMLKNLAGSAVAGSLGGYNAHASNIVSAIFLATGQDPAQNVESSHCITMMEAVHGGKDLHVSVTMPSIEVGTVGGGTQLASQSACLNLLGVKGASMETPGANSRLLATIIAGSVLAGELSLMSALAAGQLVKSHMKYNRSSKDVTQAAC